jgi:hypothetical protein
MNKQTKPPTVQDALDEIDTQTLHGAMALAFAEIEAAAKSAENPAFKQGGKNSRYADLPAVIAALKPVLARHGLFVTQHCHPSPDGVSVETVLHHANGESMSLGTIYVPANKRDAHGFGSANTYARRYGLQTAFVLPTEDDDGNAAVSTLAEPESTAKISAVDYEKIKALAPKAGKSLEDLEAAFEVKGLLNLTTEQAAKCIKRLQELAKEPA